jgi:hypothetical protein
MGVTRDLTIDSQLTAQSEAVADLIGPVGSDRFERDAESIRSVVRGHDVVRLVGALDPAVVEAMIAAIAAKFVIKPFEAFNDLLSESVMDNPWDHFEGVESFDCPQPNYYEVQALLTDAVPAAHLEFGRNDPWRDASALIVLVEALTESMLKAGIKLIRLDEFCDRFGFVLAVPEPDETDPD